MFRATFVILALMTLKPILMYVFMNGLEFMQVGSNSMEMSIQNIVMTVADALVLPYIFAITVATYMMSKTTQNTEKTTTENK